MKDIKPFATDPQSSTYCHFLTSWRAGGLHPTPRVCVGVLISVQTAPVTQHRKTAHFPAVWPRYRPQPLSCLSTSLGKLHHSTLGGGQPGGELRPRWQGLCCETCHLSCPFVSVPLLPPCPKAFVQGYPLPAEVVVKEIEGTSTLEEPSPPHECQRQGDISHLLQDPYLNCPKWPRYALRH